jgi:hypothetical protein
MVNDIELGTVEINANRKVFVLFFSSIHNKNKRPYSYVKWQTITISLFLHNNKYKVCL